MEHLDRTDSASSVSHQGNVLGRHCTPKSVCYFTEISIHPPAIRIMSEDNNNYHILSSLFLFPVVFSPSLFSFDACILSASEREEKREYKYDGDERSDIKFHMKQQLHARYYLYLHTLTSNRRERGQ
jgi:hypothetical protein